MFCQSLPCGNLETLSVGAGSNWKRQMGAPRNAELNLWTGCNDWRWVMPWSRVVKVDARATTLRAWLLCLSLSLCLSTYLYLHAALLQCCFGSALLVVLPVATTGELFGDAHTTPQLIVGAPPWRSPLLIFLGCGSWSFAPSSTVRLLPPFPSLSSD